MRNSNPKAKNLSADDMGGLQPTLPLCKNARVMLTRNLWTEAGLCNGTMGTVKHILYNKSQNPPDLPVIVVVQFDENYIGPSICEDTPRSVPIPPVTNTSDSLGYCYERQQLPLRLYRVL